MSSRFALSKLLLLLPSAVFSAVAHAQPALPSVPVGLSTRDPNVTWGTIERRPDPMANSVASAANGSKAGAEAAPDPHAHIAVSGLKGTLNKDDVHQTMEARQRHFDACIHQAQRSVGWVSGGVRYAFKVDGRGRVAELHPLASNIGHQELEACLTAVVSETQFPKPAGRATAEFTWGMSVESPNARELAALKAKAASPLIRKHRREIMQSCEVPRRARYKITTYVSTTGTLLSAGGFGSSNAAQDKLGCVLDQVSKWHLPKQKRASKLSFDLR
jgi:hypothetical protein